MKSLLFTLCLIFALPSIGHSQYLNHINYNINDENINRSIISLTKFQKSKKSNIPKRFIRFWAVGGVLTISGVGMFIISKNTHEQYRNLKNEIINNSTLNNFTKTELEAIDNERLKILKKANKQSGIGIGLASAGLITIGVTLHSKF